MTQREDFVSFDKALMELKLRSEELRRLVSEGEIRAFRDGESMKFKREEVEGLVSKRAGEEQLVFADALEDDTGMVTEELSEADTLLAEDDLVEPVEVTTVERTTRVGPATGRTRTRVDTVDAAREPGWVTGVAIFTSVVLIYAILVVYQTAAEVPPDGITGLFKK